MVVKIYGAFFTGTRRIALILRELQVPYEIIHVDIKNGEHKSPAFLSHQPFGEIPYIVDADGFELFESKAISRYLVEKYGRDTGLIPGLNDGDTKKLGKFEEAVSIETSNFEPYVSAIIGEKIFKPMLGLVTDEAVVNKNATILNTKLDVYDTILSKQKYLAGDDLTLADLFHVPNGAFLATAGIDALTDPRRPNLVRWWKDISSRPSWKAVLDAEK